MNGLGLKYWANDSGKYVMPGLISMLGLLFMVAVKLVPARFSTAAFAIGVCLIATGLIMFIIRHLMRRRLFREDVDDEE